MPMAMPKPMQNTTCSVACAQRPSVDQTPATADYFHGIVDVFWVYLNPLS